VHRLNVNAGHSFLRSVVICITCLIIIFSFFVSSAATAQEVSFLEKIDAIEEKVFFHKSSNDTKEERLSRIEKFIFRKAFPKESLANRIDKIKAALHIEDEEPEYIPQENQNTLTAEEIDTENIQEDFSANESNSIVPSTEDTGVIGTISKIEKKIFGTTYDEKPFQSRIEALEEEVLSGFEKFKAKKKDLFLTE